MKETTKTALRASAVLAVAFGLCVTGLTAADAKNPIKDAMQKYNKAPKGTDPVCKKAGAGTATKEEISGMLAAYKAMCAAKPPQGDQAKWTKLCTDLVNATAALEKGEAGAAEKFKAANNCKTCHDEFRPAKK
jgi:cytochrome c556